MGGKVIEYAIVGMVLFGAIMTAVYFIAKSRETHRESVDPQEQLSFWGPYQRTINPAETEIGIRRVGSNGALYERRVLAIMTNAPADTYGERLERIMHQAWYAAHSANNEAIMGETFKELS